MPDGIDDIREGVRRVGMSDPMAQIAGAMGRVGGALQEGAARAKRTVEDAAGAVRRTVQGTTRGEAAKPRGDIALPAAERRKRLRKIVVDRSTNGGFIARHHYKPEYGGTPKPDTHTFSSYDDLHKHIEGFGGSDK